MNKTRKLLLLLAVGLFLAGCDNMTWQPKIDEPYGESPTFETAARQLDPNAVPVGEARVGDPFYTGMLNGAYVDELPFELTEAVLEEGRFQYESFCMPCHGLSGYGDGIVAQEGFPPPASYHTDELRARPVGYFYEVITDGFGVMYSYASRIQPEDRWAVAAYVRALQISQYSELDDLPEDLRGQFDTSN